MPIHTHSALALSQSPARRSSSEGYGLSSSTATLSGAAIPVTTTRVGTFYQASAGISGQVLNTGLLGFVRGDARFGENLSGWSLLAGGRYTF